MMVFDETDGVDVHRLLGDAGHLDIHRCDTVAVDSGERRERHFPGFEVVLREVERTSSWRRDMPDVRQEWNTRRATRGNRSASTAVIAKRDRHARQQRGLRGRRG